MRKLILPSLFMLTPLFTGCMDITGRGAAPLHRTIGAEAAAKPRVGHVYCMRGWLGIFSTGMDRLAEEIDAQVGAPAVSVADEEWRRLKGWIVDEHSKGKITEPLVLLGHSWGADDQIRVAEQLKEKGISVNLLILIDPVTPPPIPSNVKRAFCVYKSHPGTDAVPFWRGVSAACEDPKATPLVNIDLRTAKVNFDTTDIDHINIEKSAGVHQMVMDQIKLVCPLRTEWAKSHSPTGQALSQAPLPPQFSVLSTKLFASSPPVQQPPAPPPPNPLEVAIAIVFDRDRRHVLICKRKPDTVLPGYWEFPGGKCDPGETPDHCATREVLEETGITVRALRELATIDHHYPHAHVRIHPFLCEYLTGDLQLLAVADAQWIDPIEAIRFHFPEANLPLVQAIAAGFDALNTPR